MPQDCEQTMKNDTSRHFVSSAQELFLHLREHIRGGGYALGAAMPTERELCAQFGASRWVVRKALQQLEYERLIVRQQGRGTFVASALDTKPMGDVRTGLLGLIVREVDYGFARLVQGVSDIGNKAHYSISINSVHSLREEAQAIRNFSRNNMLGVMVTLRSAEAAKYYDEMRNNDTAVVLVDTLIPGRNEDYVISDNVTGTTLATTHLIELGHRRIAYVTHDRFHGIRCRLGDGSRGHDFPVSRDRLRGFMQTCHEHDIPIRTDEIIETNEDDYRDPLLRLLERADRPTAVVAYNDMWAIRIIQTARAIGLSVPNDLSVVGFDDSVMAPDYDIPLTTINPERYDMGAAATQMLIEKIEQPGSRPTHGVLVTPRLVVRQSTSAPPTAHR